MRFFFFIFWYFLGLYLSWPGLVIPKIGNVLIILLQKSAEDKNFFKSNIGDFSKLFFN